MFYLVMSFTILFQNSGFLILVVCHATQQIISFALIHNTGIPCFYCALPYCASQIYCIFLQSEGLWQPCIKQVYRCHFSNSICSLRVSVSHFGNAHNISDFFITIIFAMVIRDH